MEKIVSLISVLLMGGNSLAFVSAPSTAGDKDWSVEAGAVYERGKVEPNENRNSFQSAKIDIYQLGVTKKLKGLEWGSDHYLHLDYKEIRSAKEEVNSQVFYDADQGQVLTASFGFDFVHEPKFKSGAYVQVSPSIRINKDKFSNPRVDVWGVGFKTYLELGDLIYSEDLLHIGSGIPGHQNSYLAWSHLFAAKLERYVGSPVVLKWGPYAELDTSERTDSAYDSAFTPAGTRDRIRSMKVGTISAVEFLLPQDAYGSIGYVQKLGGYDAPATQAFSLKLGINFQ